MIPQTQLVYALSTAMYAPSPQKKIKTIFKSLMLIVALFVWS